jgi:hypothetical protein
MRAGSRAAAVPIMLGAGDLRLSATVFVSRPALVLTAASRHISDALVDASLLGGA